MKNTMVVLRTMEKKKDHSIITYKNEGSIANKPDE